MQIANWDWGDGGGEITGGHGVEEGEGGVR